MPVTKKQWLSKAHKKADSFTGSFVSHVETRRSSMLNPKLLEMVIKTINKRPTIAGEFQQGLARTAAQTWNTHLAERKKMTKKQKVVEEIASNLGLAKGFRNEIQDEAERLVSILFKEIGKKKPKEEEESTDESTESVEEETDDKSIESITDIPEPAPPPKPSVVKKIVQPKVFPHVIPHTFIRRKKSIEEPSIKEEEKPRPTSTPTLGLSFINVTELKVRTSIAAGKDDKIEEVKPPPRVYVEITRKLSEYRPFREIHKKKLHAIRPFRIQERTLKKEDIQPVQKSIDTNLRVRVDPRERRASNLWKYLNVKGIEGSKPLGSQYSSLNLQRLRDRAWRKAWGRDADLFVDKEKSITSLRRITDRPTIKQSRPSRKRESGDDRFDERTKQYVIQQIKEMLSMLTYSKKNPEVELAKQRRRQRKSIFVLWKNYFDIRNMESINEGRSYGFKKIQREELLKEVDIELVKTGIYGKLAALLGEKSAKSPYEQALWRYLNERAKMVNDDVERCYDKALEHNISILEEQLRKWRTPEEVIREQERRQKAMDDYMALLIPKREKYCAKRPNTRETTMEEILKMRGFRGPPKNSKNTIWIKRPDFIGFLQPLKKKPKTVYDPSKLKLSKKDSGDVGNKSIESSLESESLPYCVSIHRAPLSSEAKLAVIRPPQVTKKRLGPFVKPERGFIKYFGTMDQR